MASPIGLEPTTFRLGGLYFAFWAVPPFLIQGQNIPLFKGFFEMTSTFSVPSVPCDIA